MQTTDIPKQYTVSQAINRLVNRFKSDKIFVKAEDLNALKEVAIALNFLFSNSKKNHNQYFKLGCKMLLMYLQHYKSWKIAVKQLKSDLDMPIEFYEQMILAESNSIHLSNFITDPKEIDKMTDEEVFKLAENVSGINQNQCNSLIYDILSDLFIKNSAHGTSKH